MGARPRFGAGRAPPFFVVSGPAVPVVCLLCGLSVTDDERAPIYPFPIAAPDPKSRGPGAAPLLAWGFTLQ